MDQGIVPKLSVVAARRQIKAVWCGGSGYRNYRNLGLGVLRTARRNRSAASAERSIAAEPRAASSRTARYFEKRSSCARWGSRLAQLDAATVRRVRVTTTAWEPPWEDARFSRSSWCRRWSGLLPDAPPRGRRRAMHMRRHVLSGRIDATLRADRCESAWTPGSLAGFPQDTLLLYGGRAGIGTNSALRERSSAACFLARTTTPPRMHRYTITR